MSGLVSEMVASMPGRRHQIDTLLALFGQKSHYTVPSVYVYGHTATGKSYVIKGLLDRLQVPHVVVNCIECYTSRLLYECVLSQLTDAVHGPHNDFSSTARADNMNDFIRHFRQALHDKGQDQETVYIVLEQAERLRDMDSNILPALLQLQQLSRCNVCVVLVSEILWEKYPFPTGCLQPLVVHFPDYNKDQMLEILGLDCPGDYDPDLYGGYCNLLLSVFYTACRDFTELRHLAALNFPAYVEPIVNGEAAATDTRKLWRNIEPHLKKALQTVYLREISSAQWEQMQQAADKDSEAMQIQDATCRGNMELPFYSKYLLIAAYIASYNPASSDRRFFSKNVGRMSSRMKKSAKKTERTSSQLLGPKPFPMDRLMAIFYVIVEDKVVPTAHIFSQISSLVTLHLLDQTVGSDTLEAPKYKCLVSLDFIKSIARTVRFDVARHLYDFL